MDSLILDTVIGVVFVFGVFTFAVSGVMEAVARFLGLRAEFLLRGVSSLLETDTTFGRGWLTKLADKAALAQREEDQRASQGAATQLDALIKTGVRPELAVAVGKLSEAIGGINALSGTSSTPAAREAAEAAISTVPLALARAEAALNLRSESKRSKGLAQVAELRSLMITAQRAAAAATGSRSGISGASLMRQPIVDLTAARRLPSELGTVSMSLKQKRSLPSYMSARTFSRALMQVLVPAEPEKTTVADLRAAISTLPGDSALRQTLAGHLDAAEESVSSFRSEIENWYDDHMARVSGWYKRHTRRHTLIVAGVLAVVLNINAVSLARSFYADEALRSAVVTAAVSAADCRPDAETAPASSPTSPASESAAQAECLQKIRTQINGLRAAGLPLGWGEVSACRQPGAACSDLQALGILPPPDSAEDPLLHLLVIVAGWMIITLSALLGARFWFDLLSRLGTLRSTGAKPKSPA